MKKKLSLIPVERIERIIYVIRDRKVILDEDLAKLYDVTTFNLNKAIKRNFQRFPPDFVFQLKKEEWDVLKFQIGISNKGRGGRRYLPYAFTEYGAVMAANVLRSKRAVEMSIEVVRAFIRLRQVFASHQEFAKEIMAIKSFALKHAQKTDQEFQKVWRAIEKLATPVEPQRRIGFRLE